MQTDVSFWLKRAVKHAAKIREDSWSDKKGEYTTALCRACSIAARKEGFDTEMAEVIYLLLSSSWCEALEWADRVTKC